MTIYVVHIYREMRLVYGGIEGDTPEAAAAIARDKPTEQADEIDDCEGRTFSALVDVRGDEDYEQSEVIDFEVERRFQAASRMLAALRAFVEADELAAECQEWKWENLDHAFKLARGAVAEADAAGLTSPSPPAVDPAKKPYSVLLAYPDYLDFDGTETFYAFAEAPDSVTAVAEARRQAVAANDCVEINPADFVPLLVTEGHHHDQPMTND